MTYSATYCALISKRLQNPITKKDCYCEAHHIIPKSEGGPDDKDNIVNLTAREHYVAHLLLAKIYDDYKMWNAIHRLIHGNEKPYARITSRMYSTIKTQFSKKLSESQRGENNPMFGKHGAMFGKHHSNEARRKISEALKGRTFSEETQKKMAEAKRGENNPWFRLHWYNNGTKSVRAKECPTGFVPGRIQKNTKHQGFKE